MGGTTDTGLKDIPRAALISDHDPNLARLLKQHKISQDEYARARSIAGRELTLAEMGVFSAMWSEHCSYKSSRLHLRRFPTTGENVVVGPGENAGVVRLSGKLCAAFKMESHNHPSFIEPYQGSATGVGGILRDVFCMGARPVANLNCLRFGRMDHPKTSHLTSWVVRGIGDYGNCVGIPTVAGNVSFNGCYDGNILVNAMTVGLIHEDGIFKGYASGVGNLLVYVGSATGRDGIHGATMASDNFSSSEQGERSTVQVGDPFTEKLLLETTLEALQKNLVVGLQDMGAAGLTSSSFEMAARAENGLYIDLEKVPVRAVGITAYELLLSESQERMLMVVEPAKWEALQEVLKRWDLPFAIIGKVTDTKRVQAVFGGKLEIDLPVAPLADDAPRYDRPQRERTYATDVLAAQKAEEHLTTQDRKKTLEACLGALGNKEPLYTQYDHHIGTKTVFGPRDGGAGVMWIRDTAAEHEFLGLLVSTDCNERFCEQDPHLGAAHAVTKCARAISAAGGVPLAITDCLNYGNPEIPEVMWQISRGVDGISMACKGLSIPVVSGNVSLYNATDGRNIFPTPMIGMVGRMDDVRLAVPAVARRLGNVFLIVPSQTKPSLTASLAAHLAQVDVTGSLPTLDLDAELIVMNEVRKLIQGGLVFACRDVGQGGIAPTLAKLAGPGRQGFQGSTAEIPGPTPFHRWFAEWGAAYLVVSELDSIAQNISAPSVSCLRLGQLTTAGEFNLDGEILTSAAIADAFARPFAALFQ